MNNANSYHNESQTLLTGNAKTTIYSYMGSGGMKVVLTDWTVTTYMRTGIRQPTWFTASPVRRYLWHYGISIIDDYDFS